MTVISQNNVPRKVQVGCFGVFLQMSVLYSVQGSSLCCCWGKSLSVLDVVGLSY